ncbi:RNase adapter RapZ [Psittacicella gerlachiana]|uniref:RNase adaptor protein RapZ n=1 Tax=Psittacicella gerlachiana TaxID=2028574 RepID=A0A3A1YI81_9GAMM|nr:RNase adapter RapZ [Psittacicella gerlachiana]RIY35727.1 RNase adaptor protein RapZ [Psittacicella gerlachiana]
MDLIVISGRSGAGKSVVLSVLEDQGYYCIDNIPVKLLETVVNALNSTTEKVAISLDIRNLKNLVSISDINQELQSLRKKFNTTLLFLDCNHDVIVSRYADTRRSHPLMQSDNLTLDQAISQEYQLLSEVKDQADIQIDTTGLNVHGLASRVINIVQISSCKSSSSEFKLIFNSFGFKKGPPPSSNFVFDVRHLPNPYWDKKLAVQTGEDADVQEFFGLHNEPALELDRIKTYLNGWIEAVDKTTSRRFVTISIGCTGGQHRSVYIADQLARYYAHKGFPTQVHHFSLGVTHTFNQQERAKVSDLELATREVEQ